MKVIQINCVYAKGSTGKITKDLHEGLLEKGVDSIVIYGRGQKSSNPRVIKVCSEFYAHINKVWSFITGLMYGGCFFSTNRIIRIIKKEKPDVVHLQCINGNFVNIYRLVTWLKKHNIKTVLTLHAEFMHTANCGYALDCEKWKTGCGHCPRLKQVTHSWFLDGTHRSWVKMKKAFDGFDNLIVTSVSPWLMDRAKQSLILADKKNCVVMNGLDTSIFHYYDTSDLRKKMGLENKKVVFHATPSFNDNPNHIKGGYYLIELAKQLPEITFVVAGSYPEGLSVPDNMRLLGPVTDQIKLAQLYSMADVTVITSQRETFSMITAESLCCGTPVVGFKAGGPETITIDEYSEFVEYGDLNRMSFSVDNMITAGFKKDDISNLAIAKYSKKTMVSSFEDVYRGKL